jgi:hypothetical protein
MCGLRGVDGVADRLFVDLAADGRVSVGTWLEGELPGAVAREPCALAWPLDPDALEDLRWYLVLRVTQDEHGGAAQDEHVEPDIPGGQLADGAHGVAVVLTVSRCAARMTP